MERRLPMRNGRFPVLGPIFTVLILVTKICFFVFFIIPIFFAVKTYNKVFLYKPTQLYWFLFPVLEYKESGTHTVIGTAVK
jgi:hypothetical protein